MEYDTQSVLRGILGAERAAHVAARPVVRGKIAVRTLRTEVRIVQERAAPGSENAGNLAQIVAKHDLVEMHHRVPAVEQRDRTVRNGRQLVAGSHVIAERA